MCSRLLEMCFLSPFEQLRQRDTELSRKEAIIEQQARRLDEAASEAKGARARAPPQSITRAAETDADATDAAQAGAAQADASEADASEADAAGADAARAGAARADASEGGGLALKLTSALVRAEAAEARASEAEARVDQLEMEAEGLPKLHNLSLLRRRQVCFLFLSLDTHFSHLSKPILPISHLYIRLHSFSSHISPLNSSSGAAGAAADAARE